MKQQEGGGSEKTDKVQKKASVVVVSQRREVQVFDQKHPFFFSLKTYKVTGHPEQEVPGGSPCNHVNVHRKAPQKKKLVDSQSSLSLDLMMTDGCI